MAHNTPCDERATNCDPVTCGQYTAAPARIDTSERPEGS